MADSLSIEDRLRAIEDVLLGILSNTSHSSDEVRELMMQRLAFAARMDDQLEGKEFNPKLLASTFDERRLQYLERYASWLRKNQADLLLVISINPAFAEQRFNRAVELSIYISNSDSEDIRRLSGAMYELADEIALDVIREAPSEFGSWFKTIIGRTREALTNEEVQEGLQKVQRGLELKHLYREQAKADLDLSKAAKNISEILAKQDNCVVILGSVCGVKRTINHEQTVMIVALTQEELLAVANNPQLRKGPKELLELLEMTRNGERPHDNNDASIRPPSHKKSAPASKINKRSKLSPPTS